MDLDVLETYAQAKLDVFKAESKLLQQQVEIVKLKEQLKNSKSKEQLKEYFSIYGTDSIYIDDSKKKELLDFLGITKLDKA